MMDNDCPFDFTEHDKWLKESLREIRRREIKELKNLAKRYGYVLVGKSHYEKMKPAPAEKEKP